MSSGVLNNRETRLCGNGALVVLIPRHPNVSLRTIHILCVWISQTRTRPWSIKTTIFIKRLFESFDKSLRVSQFPYKEVVTNTLCCAAVCASGLKKHCQFFLPLDHLLDDLCTRHGLSTKLKTGVFQLSPLIILNCRHCSFLHGFDLKQ